MAKLTKYHSPLGDSRIPPLYVPLRVVVKYLGCAEDTVRRYADNGTLTTRRDKNDRREFLFLDVVNLLKQRKREAAEAARRAVKEVRRGQAPKD